LNSNILLIYAFVATFFVLAFLLLYYSLKYAALYGSGRRQRKSAASLLFIIAAVGTILSTLLFPNMILRLGALIFLAAGTILLIYNTISAWNNIRRLFPGSFLKITWRLPGSLYNLIGISILAFFILPSLLLELIYPESNPLSWNNPLGYALIITCFVGLVLGIKTSIHSLSANKYEIKQEEVLSLRDDILLVKALGSLINKLLENIKPDLWVVREIISEVMEHNPLLFQDCRFGRYDTINFEPAIKNIDRVQGDDRLTQISLMFSALISKVLNLYGAMTSPEQGNKALTESVKAVRKTYGHYPIFLEILRRLPDGVMEEEKVSLLSKEELEKRVRNRTQELEAARDHQARLLKDLRNAEANLSHVVTKIADGIVIVDKDNIVRFVNTAAEAIFARKEKEWLGKSFHFIIKPNELMEFELMHEYGEPLLAEMHAVEIEWENKRATLASIRDITKRKRTEEEKEKLEAQLIRAQKMEAIGTLAGGVAHDLNNVLTGIVTYPDVLLMGLPEDNPLRKPILTIQKSGQKAADIVQDLLTLARRGVVASEIMNLNIVINSYLSSPEHEKLKEFHPDVNIESDLELNLLNIMGSSVHLSKTVMNLVSNAAEAMPGGGNIFISTENRYIDKPIRGYDDVKEGDYVILTVSDTGVGISSEDMGRIFEPFYTKKVMGRSGTGLGMAVVWGTVKDHKGYIDIKSTAGRGTTFTLYFPVTRKEIMGKEESLPMEEYMGKGEQILVVDDVEEQKEIASIILNKLSYSVTSVSSGEEAVDYMKDNSADLIVLDMIMDLGIDGLETYKQILELHPGQKAIIASGFSESDRVKEAQRLGAGQYIKKPYTLEKIGLAVKKELGK